MRVRQYNTLTAAQRQRRDNAVVDFIFNHKGIENVVSTREIAEYITAQGIPMRETYVPALIRQLAAERYLPICSHNSKGYYWASSKADLLATIADLESRIAAMTEHANRLKAFIFE